MRSNKHWDVSMHISSTYTDKLVKKTSFQAICLTAEDDH